MRNKSQNKKRWKPVFQDLGAGGVGGSAFWDTVFLYHTPHLKHWKDMTLREPREQRVISPASPTICELNKSNINSHLPRVHQWCVETRGVWDKGERAVCGLWWTLMRHLGKGEPANSAEGLHGSSTRQPAPQRASLILSWLTLRAESPSLHSQTYPGLVCWEGATGVGPDDQIKCLPEFRLSWLYRIPVISVLVTGSNILFLAAQVNG